MLGIVDFHYTCIGWIDFGSIDNDIAYTYIWLFVTWKYITLMVSIYIFNINMAFTEKNRFHLQ